MPTVMFVSYCGPRRIDLAERQAAGGTSPTVGSLPAHVALAGWGRLLVLCVLVWGACRPFGSPAAVAGSWVLPGRHIAVIEGATRLLARQDGKALFVAGNRVGQLIRNWQEPVFEIRTLPLQSDPIGRDISSGGAAFSAEGTRLFWADNVSGEILVFGADDGVLVARLRVAGGQGGGMGPWGEVAMGGGDRALYLEDRGTGRVLVVNPETGAVGSWIPSGGTVGELRVVGSRLYGLRLAGGGEGGFQGELWQADVSSAVRPVVLHRWALDRIWRTLVAGGRSFGGDVLTGGLAADGESLFAAIGEYGGLLRVDLRSRKVGAWRELTGINSWGVAMEARPQGLALSPEGDRLYVAQAGLDAIGVLDASTLGIVGQIPTPGYPTRVVVSPSGAMLACLSLEGLPVASPPGNGEDTRGAGSSTLRSILTILTVPGPGEWEAGTQQVLARSGLAEWNPRGGSLTIADGGGGATPGDGGTGNGNGNGSSARPLPVLQLPIEVLGLGGTVEEARLTLTAVEALRAAALLLTVHGLQYEDKARLTINARHTVSINHRTARVLGNAKQFGGIGGGFHTLPLEIELPRGVLREGENQIRFEYTRKDSYAVSGFSDPDNRIDDASSGYRVVRLNLRDRSGKILLGPERMQDDDPTGWGPPGTAVPLDQAVMEGGMLWRGWRPDGTRFLLKNASGIGLTPPLIQATCSDCHAHDGRDLKYFNYSNRSIVARSVIHGLTEEEGRRVAAYIRTRPGAPVVPQARPWNPPFQPGPGLDSRPVYEWAAGAGIDAVVEDPVETFNGIFPGAYRRDESGKATWDISRITTGPIRPEADLSMREVPISMQLLDWNHWLPKAHPMDAYADMLETNAVVRRHWENYQRSYTNLFAHMRTAEGPTNFSRVVSFARSAHSWMQGARNAYGFDKADHTLKEAQRRYALMLLPLVKSWEFYMEYGLGDQVALATCGPAADERSWRVGMIPFAASPNIAGLVDTREAGVPYVPFSGHGIGNNEPVTFTYISAAWYHLQLILDHGNRNPLCGVNQGSPLDWPYAMAVLKRLQSDDTGGAGISMIPLLYLYLAKAPQIYDTGLGVENAPRGGWHPFLLMPYYLHTYSYGTKSFTARMWEGVSTAAKGRMMDALYRVWMEMNLQSNREEYYAPAVASVPTSFMAYVPDDSPIGTGGPHRSLADRLHYLFTWKVAGFDGTLSGFGVDPALQNQMLDWAQTIWPTQGDGSPVDWDRLRPRSGER